MEGDAISATAEGINEMKDGVHSGGHRIRLTLTPDACPSIPATVKKLRDITLMNDAAKNTSHTKT